MNADYIAENIAEDTFGNVKEKFYAGILARCVAYVVDCSILFVGLIVWQAALYVFNPIVAILKSGQLPANWQLHLWVFGTATIPFLLYFAFMQSSARQATFGMRWLKLKVTDLNGERIRFGQALLRSAVMLIPFEVNHAVMFHLTPRGATHPSTWFWFGYAGVWILIGVYLGSILLTRRRQSLHDLIASTVVKRSVPSL